MGRNEGVSKKGRRVETGLWARNGGLGEKRRGLRLKDPNLEGLGCGKVGIVNFPPRLSCVGISRGKVTGAVRGTPGIESQKSQIPNPTDGSQSQDRSQNS